jgi:hypothetical protein
MIDSMRHLSLAFFKLACALRCCLPDPTGAPPIIISNDQIQWVWALDPSKAPVAGLQSSGHVGGPFVNSCTFTVTCGCDRADLVFTHTGSFGRQTLLEVPVLLEAGPVAVDGLQLQHAQAQPHSTHATALYSCKMLGYADPGSLQQLVVPPDAAAGAATPVKQEPGTEGAAQQQQQGSRGLRRQPQSTVGDKDEPIDLTLTDDESEDDAGIVDMNMEQPEQRQPQPLMSPVQQWLAGLGPSQAALLYQLQPQVAGDVAQLVEGSTVKLQLQLYDSAAHEVAAEKEGKLMLLRLQNLQLLQQRQPDQQIQANWQVMAGHSEASLERGTAEVVLQLGVGDEWVGEQVFMVQPTAAEDSELSTALPVLLKVNIAPGPFASGLERVQTAQHPAAAAAGAPASSSTCQVTAAEALEALYGGALQQQALLQQLPGLLDTQQSPQQLSGEQCTILQVSSSSSGPAAVLPELAVQLSSRDRSAFALQSLQPLRLQLQVWEPPAAAAAADGAVGAWVAVRNQQQPRFGAAAVGNAGIESVQAVLRDLHRDAGADQQQQQAVFEVPISCRQLPAQAGLYRIVAAYDSDLVTQKGMLYAMSRFQKAVTSCICVMLLACFARVIPHELCDCSSEQLKHADAVAALMLMC